MRVISVRVPPPTWNVGAIRAKVFDLFPPADWTRVRMDFHALSRGFSPAAHAGLILEKRFSALFLLSKIRFDNLANLLQCGCFIWKFPKANCFWPITRSEIEDGAVRFKNKNLFVSSVEIYTKKFSADTIDYVTATERFGLMFFENNVGFKIRQDFL